MSILDRRKREKEQRKEDILAVTRRLILAKGVNALSLQDVANALEISKATLYLSFQSKDDLLLEILAEASDEFLTFLQKRVEQSASGLGDLIAMAHGYFEFYKNQEDLFVLFGLKEYFSPTFPFVDEGRLGNLPELVMDLIRRSLTRGQQDGSLDPSIDPETMTLPIVFLATSFVDKVAKIPKDLRSSLPILPHMHDAFSLLLRAVAHPNIPRKLLDQSLASGSSADLCQYWKEK